MRLVVGHLYPDYLNIYADRGNIAVLASRAAWRGHELEVRSIGLDEPVLPGEHDLFYIGGGQDREQALIAPDLASKRDGLVRARWTAAPRCSPYAAATSCSDAATSTRAAPASPVSALFPHETVAGDRRMIGDVLLECELEPGETRTLAGFENHAGRTLLDADAEPLGRVVAGFGNDGESGYEGLPSSGTPSGRTCTARSCRAIPGSRTGSWYAPSSGASASRPSSSRSADELELEAHAVAAARARDRGGRY